MIEYNGRVCYPTLALDLALNTGFAQVTDCNGLVRMNHGVFRIESKGRKESDGVRFLLFNQWLSVLLDYNNFELVTYEMPHLRGFAATQLLIGLSTRVIEQCTVRGIDYRPVETSTLKLFATGRGNSKKPDMQAAVVNTFGVDDYDPQTDPGGDAADAIIALHYAMAGFPKMVSPSAAKIAMRKHAKIGRDLPPTDTTVDLRNISQGKRVQRPAKGR